MGMKNKSFINCVGLKSHERRRKYPPRNKYQYILELNKAATILEIWKKILVLF